MTYLKLTFLLLISLNSFSQNSFQLIFGKVGIVEIPNQLIETSDNNYIAFVRSFGSENENSQTKIISFNNISNLNIKKEISDYEILGVKKIDENYFCYGLYFAHLQPEMFSMILDSSFNVITTNHYSIPNYQNNDLLESNCFLHEDDKIYCMLNNYHNNSHYEETFCYIFSENADSIGFININGKVYDFCKNTDNSGYLMTGEFADFPCVLGNVPQVAQADSLFNIYKVDSLKVNSSLFLGFCNIETINGNIVISGRTMNYYEGDLIGIAIFDTTSACLQYNTIGNSDVNQFFARKEGLIVDKYSDILFAGTSDFGQYFFNIEDNYIVVSKTDTELNKKWEHYIGGDAYYELYNMIICNDGGIILNTVRYDENINDNDYDVCFFKLDSEGNLTNIPENTEIKSSELILYPNPATDYINIRYGAHLHDVVFDIYDISGKLILSQNLENPETQIDISSLNSGTYIFKSYNKERDIETGKFVKE